MFEGGNVANYRNGVHYDLINNFDYDLPFYQEICEQYGSEVLELACGTGRVAIPLAENGFSVTGVDVSKEMLTYAQLKAQQKKAKVDWVLGDMTQVQLNKQFDVIYCVHNSFCHLTSFEEVTAFFQNVTKHLKNDGCFVLQLFTPELEILCRNPEEEFPLIAYQAPNTNQTIQLFESSYYEEDTQICYNKWIFKEGDNVVDTQHFSVKAYFPVEMDFIVQLNGFVIEEKYGDFDKTPFEEYPDTQIFVLRKSAN